MSLEKAVAEGAMSASLRVTVPDTLGYVGREAAKPASGGPYHNRLYLGADPIRQIVDSVGGYNHDSRLQQAVGYDPMSRRILGGIPGTGPSPLRRPEYERALYQPNPN